MYLAALHWNENSDKEQAKTKDGELRWKVSFPKYKKKDIAQPVREEATYGMLYVI